MTNIEDFDFRTANLYETNRWTPPAGGDNSTAPRRYIDFESLLKGHCMAREMPVPPDLENIHSVWHEDGYDVNSDSRHVMARDLHIVDDAGKDVSASKAGQMLVSILTESS